MKKILALVVGLTTNFAVAQLYVGPNSYMYVNDRYVFETKAVNIASGTGINGKIYLRGDGQLLQGNNNFENSGTGVISVFQEGNGSVFDYNYWCSPVGSANQNSGNQLFGTSMLHYPLTATNSEPFNFTDESYDGVALNRVIAEYWIFKILMIGETLEYANVGKEVVIPPGHGYTMKGMIGTDPTTVLGVQNNPGENQRYDFRGRPNNGIFGFPVLPNQSTLTGNPYPCAVDLTRFLLDHTNVSKGIAYFWEDNNFSHSYADYNGGYGIFSPVAENTLGIYLPADYIKWDEDNRFGFSNTRGVFKDCRFLPIAEGVVIEGLADAQLNWNNKYRVYAKESYTTTDIPQIKSIDGYDYSNIDLQPVPQIHFRIEFNQNSAHHLALGFYPNASTGLESGSDAQYNEPNNINYACFVTSGQDTKIDVRPFNLNDEIPIRFHCAPLEDPEVINFSIEVANLINIPSGLTNIYLHDTVTGQYHAITNSTYQFPISSGTDSGSRYFIAFQSFSSSPRSSALIATEDTDLKISYGRSNSVAKIDNPNQLSLSTFTICDLAGRLIKSYDLKNHEEYNFSLEDLPNGVYVLKVDGQESIAELILK